MNILNKFSIGSRLGLTAIITLLGMILITGQSLVKINTDTKPGR